MTEEGFLRALEADPSDAAALLAWADLCQDAGEADRAKALRFLAREGKFPHYDRTPAPPPLRVEGVDIREGGTITLGPGPAEPRWLWYAFRPGGPRGEGETFPPPSACLPFALVGRYDRAHPEIAFPSLRLALGYALEFLEFLAAFARCP
jgi:uncharacterized protein (TIGR02996 family)